MVIEKLQRALDTSLRDPGIVARLWKFGMEPVDGTPSACAARIASERVRWKSALERAAITAEH